MGWGGAGSVGSCRDQIPCAPITAVAGAAVAASMDDSCSAGGGDMTGQIRTVMYVAPEVNDAGQSSYDQKVSRKNLVTKSHRYFYVIMQWQDDLVILLYHMQKLHI